MHLTLLFLLYFLSACISTEANAADAAEREVIGFSKDGDWFAFEEFGVQDGSGFPYSNIYIINTDRDAWAPKSPYRILIEREDASLKEARDKSRKAAAEALARYGTFHPGRLLASNAVGEVVPNPKLITFRRFHNVNQLWAVRIKSFPMKGPKSCEGLGRTVGIAIKAGKAEGDLRELYRDKSIPESRGCPLDYRIADVIAFGGRGSDKIVVLLHKLSFGFEGRDARYLAVPVRLSESQ